MRAIFADLDFNLNPDIEDAICAVNDKFITEFEKSKIIPRTDLQSIGYLQHRYFNYPHPNQKEFQNLSILPILHLKRDPKSL